MNAMDLERPNPFPGLRPFRSDEHHLFFGREEQTAALLQLLRTNRFLAVVGTSGSGKSSLVRAGMIAELYGGTMTQAGSTWEVMILRPGGSPIENLARAFVEADLYDREDPSTLPRLLATLNRSGFGLVEAMKQCELFEPGTNLLVVVDQFEELFRFRQQGVDSEETAAAFVNLLLTAGEQSECPIYVTITMRSDYLGDCSEIPGLAEAVNEGEYLIPRLLRDQKRDAIEKPIGVGGARIAPLLVQRLLNDVGDDPDQLPVLQHALMRMWDAWSARCDRDRPIDFADFEGTGGLSEALSNHADEIYDALPDDRHRSACEKIFKTLTVKGDDNRGIRRPTRLAQLEAIADSDRHTVTTVLDAYRGSGVTFLMPGSEVELTDRTVVDLSHESLMRGWQRLRMWVEEEAQSARIFRRLLDTARLWSDGKAGLFRDPDLQIALSWREQEAPNTEWAEQYGGDFESAIGFLETSDAETEARRRAREAARGRELDQARQLAEAQQLRLEQQQRAARRLRLMIAGLAAVAVIAGGACVVALLANQQAITLAVTARQNEEKANQNAQRAERSQKETADALRLARTAEEAGRKLLYTTDMQLAPFVWRDDRTTAEQLRVLLAKHIPESKAAANTGVIAAPMKSDLRGFEWYYYQHLLERSAMVFSGHGEAVVDAAFTAEGPLVTLDQNGQVRRWDIGSQHEEEASRRDLPGGPGAQFRVLSPDGRLAALAEGNKVRVETLSCSALTTDGGRIAVGAMMSGNLAVLDASSGRLIARHTSAHASPMRGIAFSGDGARLATADAEGTIKIWADLEKLDSKSAALLTKKGHQGAINTVRFSTDGKRLVTSSADKTARVWDLENAGAAIRPLEGLADDGSLDGTPVTRFSPDGQLIAAANGRSVRLWDAATGRLVRELSHEEKVRVSSVAFSPSDNRLLAVGYGGRSDVSYVALLDIDAAAERARLAGVTDLPDYYQTGEYQWEVGALEFSPYGKYLVAGFGSKRGINPRVDPRPLEDWEVATRRLIRRLDGRTLASGSSDQTVRLWNVETRRELLQLDHGGVELGLQVLSLAFSPDGRQLLSGWRGGAAFWSSMPIVWNDPDRAALTLRLLLHSHADFASRIRMFSENLRLHEALAKLDANDGRVQAALAAAGANWHASRKAWPEAVAAFDRLAAVDRRGPEAWLRTPGLLRLATALVHQNRPGDAAALLLGGAKRRTADGIAVIELTKEGIVGDPATGDLLIPLRALVNERLAKAPRDAGLLGLRAELAGRWSGWEAQVADYSAAIRALDHQSPEAAALLKRLYRGRGNAYVSLKKWAEALDDYAHVVTETTTDEDLLTNRARGYEALRNWEAAAADWSRATTGNPDRAKLLGEFARRLAAALERPRAKAQFDQSEALYERSLRENPENDLVARELAQLLFDKEENESRVRWAVLKPSEMKSKGGATLSKLPDESILASGKNPLGDVYTIVAPTQVTQVRAFRLEALTHESLPNQGPGRSEQQRGNIDMVNFKITAYIAGTQPRPIEVSRVAADHSYFELTANHWNLADGEGRSHTAVYLARQPVDCKDGTRLEFQMEFYPGADWPRQNLGRFRLAVADDPAAFDGEQTRIAAMKLKDPWAKLAVAYALSGRNEEATRYFTRALERSLGREARQPILEFAAHFGDLLPALIERQPDEPQLQLGLARSLARRGKQHLADKQPAKAQAELEESREILARIRAKYPGPLWTVLEPTELKSERGQTLTLQGDGSIWASGTNPDRDTCTLTAPIAGGTVAGLRLETIPDDRLKGDASRWWGEFFLTEIDLAIEAASGGTDRPLAIKDGVADFSRADDYRLSRAFDQILLQQVAALQAWFGQEKELAATRQRYLTFAKDTNNAGTAERAAKVCSIRMSTDKAELDAALAFARKGVELDHGSEWREWRLLSLGMAEYRSGNHAAATEALLAAAKAGSNHTIVTGISAFYRAMSLSRQGKTDEARQLASGAAAQMKPLPKDEQNPPAGDAYWDDLILWLAYKEAKAMIHFDAARAAPATPDRK